MTRTPTDTISIAEAASVAMRLQQAGDPGTAAQVYREILRHDPESARVAYALALCEHQLGQFDDADHHFRAAIGRDATQPQYHLGLGRNFKQQGKFSEAIDCYRKVLDLAPDTVDAMISLGIALWRDGQADEAVEVLGKALQLAPDSFEAATNCGNALLRSERHDEAIVMYHRALAVRADSPDVHSNLGKALVAVGKADEGRQCFDRALVLLPSHPEALFNIGDLLFFSGQTLEAENYYASAVAANPNFAEGYAALGRARFDAGQFAGALESFDRMAQLAPRSAAAQTWRGIVLREMQRVAEALRAFESATQLSKFPEEGYVLVGSTYRQLGDHQKAEEFADRALETKPDHASALNLKANVALTAGKIDDAITWYLKAADADRDFPMYGENALFVMSYAQTVEAPALAAAHREWGLRQVLRPPVNRRPRTASSSGRLRLGFVSPDFISHSVAHFIMPVLQYFDRNGFEIYCYSNNRKSDAVTDSLRKQATGWRSIAGRNDKTVAETIARDRIDILIDLAGHTADNRLGIFQYAPAPMQATYLGYPTTTGLTAIQYRLSDGIVDPAGADTLSTETLLRLPHSYFCYMPPEEAPAVSALPCLSGKPLTFGSFNNLAKMTTTTFQLWARILDAVPHSRLLLKNISLNDARIRMEVMERLVRAGMDPHRVELRGYEAVRTRHLMIYNEIDISLDTYPYNGATTTCESLWMGAPVISLAGKTHASRMGASILSAAGLAGWIAADEDAYVDLCVRLGNEVPVLAERRAGLRSSMAASALMDYQGFMRDFEGLLRNQFERHGHG